MKATTSTSDQNTANAIDTSYSITELDGDDLENGTEYEVAVQSIYTGGVGQPQTPWVTAIPNIGPLTTPAAPTSVQVAPGINSLDVTWTASQVTGNNAPTSYIVDWNPGPQQDAGTATSYTIPNLNAGSINSVRIRAENTAGGAWSSSVNGVPVSGPQVTTIDIESFNNSIASIRIYLANPDATQQTVYYCIIPTDRICSGTEIQNTNTPSPHTSAFLIPMNLAENTTFIVSASLDADMATNVKTARFTTLGPPDKLRLNVSPADGELYVTWSVDLNGGAPRGQILMWKLATATSFTDNVVPANNTRRYTITELNGTSLVNGTDYTVQISVQNEYGTATSDEVTRAPAPGPTVSDIASSNIEQTSATATVTAINLNLGNESVTAHLRHRVQGSTDDWSEPVTQSVSRSSSTRTVNFNLSGLTGNTNYDVQALVTEGSESADWDQSAQQTLMTAPSPPHAPEVTVQHADGELVVSWTAPDNAGGSPVTGYVVQWKSGTQSYSTSRQETTDETGTTVIIPDLTNGTEYTVQVYATNSSGNGTPAEDTATPSTVPGTAPINILASECNSSIHLSWEGPTNTGGNPISSYTIQWASGEEMFDDMATPARHFVTGNSDLMYTLESLTNGTAYSIRILATNINGDASREVTDEMTMVTTTELIWSRNIPATPREAPCISGVRFGNILADSAPIIVEVKDAEDGTIVHMQYRPVKNGEPNEYQTKTVNAGDTTVTFDTRDLQPETEYVTHVFINPGSRRFSIARAFFTSGIAPADGRTGGGGGSIARILKIEPAISSIAVSPDDRVLLDVNVFGRQGLMDNGLADRDPSDGRPPFTWTSSGGGTFSEAGNRTEWRNNQADDRQVFFIAPSNAGTFKVTTALLGSGDCQPQQDDETSDDQFERCSANFDVTVKRRSAVEPQRPAPANPPGTIPETLTDPEGTAYAVFTPVDGGNFKGEGVSFLTSPGAVANGEFIGISMANTGDAANTGATHQRYTLMGATYDIKVVDSSSEPVSDIVLQEPATVCLPLPNALRSNIADIAITAIGGDDSLTILATSVKITPDGVIVCAGISALPATVAVGALGAPLPPPDIEPVETEQALPDTGGTAPRSATLILIMLLGMAATTCALIARRRITKGM